MQAIQSTTKVGVASCWLEALPQTFFLDIGCYLDQKRLGMLRMTSRSVRSAVHKGYDAQPALYRLAKRFFYHYLTELEQRQVPQLFFLAPRYTTLESCALFRQQLADILSVLDLDTLYVLQTDYEYRLLEKTAVFPKDWILSIAQKKISQGRNGEMHETIAGFDPLKVKLWSAHPTFKCDISIVNEKLKAAMQSDSARQKELFLKCICRVQDTKAQKFLLEKLQSSFSLGDLQDVLDAVIDAQISKDIIVGREIIARRDTFDVTLDFIQERGCFSLLYLFEALDESERTTFKGKIKEFLNFFSEKILNGECSLASFGFSLSMFVLNEILPLALEGCNFEKAVQLTQHLPTDFSMDRSYDPTGEKSCVFELAITPFAYKRLFNAFCDFSPQKTFECIALLQKKSVEHLSNGTVNHVRELFEFVLTTFFMQSIKRKNIANIVWLINTHLSKKMWGSALCYCCMRDLYALDHDGALLECFFLTASLDTTFVLQEYYAFCRDADRKVDLSVKPTALACDVHSLPDEMISLLMQDSTQALRKRFLRVLRHFDTATKEALKRSLE